MKLFLLTSVFPWPLVLFSCQILTRNTHTNGNQRQVEEGRVLLSWQRHCLAEAGGRFGGREKVKEREDGVKESLEQQRDRRQFKNSVAAHLVSWFTSIQPT